MLDTLLCFFTLLALAVAFAALRGVPAGAAPLLAVAAAMVWCSLAGVLGVLVPGAWALTALAFGLCAWALFKRRLALLKKLLCPGFLLFCGLGLVLLCYFALRQPVFSQYDEFVLWGTSAKLTKLSGQLYTVAEMGWTWPATQSPSLILLGWFAQLASPGFAAWKVYWAYDVLMIACTGALVAALPLRRWRLWLPLALAGLLAPFFFTQFYETTHLATAYLTAYADVAAGMLFAGALGAWFASRQTGGGLWAAALPLAALALAKYNVLPVALVAAGVMAADCLCHGLHAKPPGARLVQKHPRLWQAGSRVAASAGLFAACLLPNAVWQRHIAWVVASGGVRETNRPASVAVWEALCQLLGLQPMEEAAARVLQEMGQGLLGRAEVGGQWVDGARPVSMLGSAVVVLLLITAVFVLAAVLAQKGTARRRVVVSGALLAGGFLGFLLMLLVFYGYILHSRGSGSIPDFERYLAAYFIGWLLCGGVFLANTAQNPAKPRARWAQAASLALALVFIVPFARMVRPGYSVLGFSHSAFSAQARRQQVANAFLPHIPEGERVFFVDDDTGEDWFGYSYYLLPRILDYSRYGGSSLARLSEDAQNPLYAAEVGDPDTFVPRYLAEKGIGYIFVNRADAWFTAHYSHLFADGLAAAKAGPALYAQGAQGLFAPVAAVAREGTP